MKIFIKKIIYFLILLLILVFPIDIYLSKKISKSNQCQGEFEVWNDIYNNNINAEIAIYGSSRAWVHINPQILTDSLKLASYNFGIDGHNFWLQYLRHIEYLKHCRQPQIILLSVDIFSIQKVSNLYNQYQFLPYMLWNKNIYDYTHSYKGYSLFDYYIPIVRFLGLSDEIKFLCNSDTTSYRVLGFKGKEEVWNDDFEKAKKETDKYSIRIDEPSKKLFEKFILECKNKNIKLILIYTPEYIDGQNFVLNRNEIIDYYNWIAKEYDLLFLDYSSNEICFQKELFYNTLHLNLTGANLFTKILASDLKQHNILHEH